MAHYAKVVNGYVTQVIVAEPEFIASFQDPEPGDWVETDFYSLGNVHFGQDGQPDGGVALRKNYAGIGYYYDRKRDAFVPPKPFASWVLNEDTCLWDAPVPYPDDGKRYKWDEETVNWIEVEA